MKNNSFATGFILVQRNHFMFTMCTLHGVIVWQRFFSESCILTFKNELCGVTVC